jgi:anti-sigma factor RsiW
VEQHVIDLLSAYLDGELPADEEQTVADHLASCAGCRSVHRDLATLSLSVRDHWAAVGVTDDLADGVWAKIEQSEQMAVGRRRLAGGAAGMLAFGALLLIGFFLTPWGVFAVRLLASLSRLLLASLSVLASFVTQIPLMFGAVVLVMAVLIGFSMWGLRKILTGIPVGG